MNVAGFTDEATGERNTENGGGRYFEFTNLKKNLLPG
jgi:hypothetical protein